MLDQEFEELKKQYEEQADLPNFEEEKLFSFEDQDLRILKNIFNAPELMHQFLACNGQEFLAGDSKEIGSLVTSYHQKFKSIPSKRILLEKTESEPDLKEKIEYFFEALNNTDASPNEFRYDLDKIKNRFLEGKKQELRLALMQDKNDWINALKVNLEKIDLIRTNRRQVSIAKSLKDHIAKFRSDYVEKLNNKDFGRGVLTGYSCLDYVKNGMFPSEMLIVAGATASGKSTFLNNIAKQMWMQQNSIYSSSFTKGFNVQYFSLEMPYEACWRRTVSCAAEVPVYGLRDSTLLAQELKRTDDTLNFIQAYPHFFEIVDIPRGCSVDQIEAKYLETSEKYPIDVVVVDYLGLLEEPGFHGEDWLKLGYIAGRLHEFARTYNVIVLTAVQLNRVNYAKVKDSSETIGTHRIGRSDLILHHANIAIQIETRQDENTYPDFRYHIIKNRDGELASHQLLKNFRCSLLKEPELPFQPEVNLFGGSGEIWDSDNEDISKMLIKCGWSN